jgi:hypothetical protein
VRIGLTSRWFATDTQLAEAARRTRDLGLDLLALESPGSVAGWGRDDVKAVGVDVGAVLAAEGGGASAENEAPFQAGIARAASVAASLRAAFVVAEGGGLGRGAGPRLRRADRRLATDARSDAKADADTMEEVIRRRGEAREKAAERAVRALHAARTTGAPLAVRNGGSAACLLGFEELEWVLDDLPRLVLFFDPARALRLHALGLGPAPAAWGERYAKRIAGVLVQGLASDLVGGSHPEDGGAAWQELAEGLPRAAPWFLDLAPTLAAADVEDAVRYLRAEIEPRPGRGGGGP